MLTEGGPLIDEWGHPLDNDPRCEFCERSLIERFGGIPAYECDACRDEFRRFADAHDGMIEIDQVEA